MSEPRLIRKCVVPAASLGTRFLPATKAIPKEMLPIVDTPTLQYIVQEAASAGIEDVILINGRGKSSIEDHFDLALELEAILKARGKEENWKKLRDISSLANIVSLRQKEPLGLGHAVLCAKDLIGYRFQGHRYDAGDKLGYLKANVAYALKRKDLRQPLVAWLTDLLHQVDGT